MEILLVGLVLGGIIAGWILYQKRQKSPQDSDDQINESAGLAISISADQGHDNYEVLEVNQSQSSDREYELLSHRQSGRISCTCRGFTYTPHDGCVHTRSYPESTDGRREGQASWDEGAYQGESLGSMGTDVTRQRVFSSHTGPRERSMEAGNRVIVRGTQPDALAARADASLEALGRLRIAPSGLGAAGRAIGPGRG